MTWLLVLYFNSSISGLRNYEVHVGSFATYEACSAAMHTSTVSQLRTNGLTNTTVTDELKILHSYCTGTGGW